MDFDGRDLNTRAVSFSGALGRHLIQKSQLIQHDRDFARLEKHN
jgi:hypothetical protein